MDSELREVLVLIHRESPQRLDQTRLLQCTPNGGAHRRRSEQRAVAHTCLRELSHLTQRVIGVKRQGMQGAFEGGPGSF